MLDTLPTSHVYVCRNGCMCLSRASPRLLRLARCAVRPEVERRRRCGWHPTWQRHCGPRGGALESREKRGCKIRK